MANPSATRFTNTYCSKYKVHDLPWSSFYEMLQNVQVYSDKKSCPMIKLAKFGNFRTKNKSLKTDNNLLELWGIEGDYDDEVISIEEARTLLEQHGIRAILYSSWSSTPEKPRWRVLAPLSKPHLKEEHGRLVARLNGALRGVLAKESFTLSQGYFIGRNQNQIYTCICTFDDPDGGEYIDQLDELEHIAISKKSSELGLGANNNECIFGTHEDWLTNLLDGEYLHNNTLRVVGRMVAQGLDDITIKSVFEAYKVKITEARGLDRAEALLGDELTQMIRGAREKGFAPINNKSLEEVIAELRRLAPEKVSRNWVNVVFQLSPVDRDAALNEVKRLTNVGISTLKNVLSSKEKDIKRAIKNNAVASRVGNRKEIHYLPEDVAKMADIAEALTVEGSSDFELAKFGGLLVRVVVEELPLAHYADTDLPPAPTAQTDIITKAKLLPLVERAVVFQIINEGGEGKNIGVPDKILEHVLANPKTIPLISSMVTHPIVTKLGRIISDIGIDQETGLLLFGNQDFRSLRPYTQAEAKEAIKRIKSSFLDGFEFSSKLDETAALALLLTAIERKLMPQAPGGLVSAAQQSTGKTTLVKILHIVLTGRDLPVMCWPDGNETEVQKMLLSTLMRSPELICFDNVGDGMTFRSPTLAMAMTSPVYEGRILGLSRDASVPTNVMLTVTGNNLKLANDEVHRWLRVSLTSSSPNPHKRQFKHPDVLKYGLSIRADVLRDCIGIIAGYRQQESRIAPSSRFQIWDDLVRQPLIWAGEEDVGSVFDANMEQSEEIGARTALLIGLHEKFAKKEFSVRDVRNCCFFPETNIEEALIELHVKDINSDLSVGHGLGKLVGIPVFLPNTKSPVGLRLTSRLVNGLKRYRVEKIAVT